MIVLFCVLLICVFVCVWGGVPLNKCFVPIMEKIAFRWFKLPTCCCCDKTLWQQQLRGRGVISVPSCRLQFITERSHGSGNSSSWSRAGKVDASTLRLSSPSLFYFRVQTQGIVFPFVGYKSSISINVIKIIFQRQVHESQLIQAVRHEGLISEVSLHCVKLTIKANHHTTREQGNPFTNSKML